jgi:single-strand DNA-binding protein
MLNHIVLMGRLTRDPELRHTQTGVAVASFTLAVEQDYKSGDDKKTDFIDIVAWRNTGEFAAKYFTKGQMVAVSGRLQLRDWTDNDGNKRRAAEVVASNVYFAEGKRNRADGPGISGHGDGLSGPVSDYSHAWAEDSGFSEVDDDGELPF